MGAKVGAKGRGIAIPGVRPRAWRQGQRPGLAPRRRIAAVGLTDGNQAVWTR